MRDAQPKFSKVELGQVASLLQRVCRECPRRALACSADQCPIASARGAIGRHLCSERQLELEIDPTRFPVVPADAVITTALVEEAASSVHALCNRCMFHLERCFMNVLYALLEGALPARPPRPLNVRPGDAPLPRPR
jgi:hypothetical protein